MQPSSYRQAPRVAQFPLGYRRAGLTLVALVYLCFVVYGSLVPLKLKPMPLGAAMEAFSLIPYLDLGVGSRADWVANILLFIPLTFLWTGVVGPARPGAMRVLSSVAVFVGAVALSVSIEFAQLFFPPRTVSMNDILAESLGAVIGIVLWWVVGQTLMRWLESLPRARGAQGIAERALAFYLFLLLGYNLLPLDLTLSPVELYHKWREGRVMWLPFSAPHASRAQLAYDLLSDVAVWVPAAMLWAYAYRTSAKRIWCYVVGAAVTLELLQLFVYSRVSDVTDVLTAAIGGALGVWAARALQAKTPTPDAAVGGDSRGRAGLVTWLALLLWLAVVLAVFWYPFDFNLDPMFLRDRLRETRRVPFEALYFGTEFRAITEVLHKVGFMFPLGALLGWIVAGGRGRLPRGLVRAAAFLFVPLVAVGVEAGQLALPGKVSDLTDVLFELAGGWLGLALGMRLRAAGTSALPIGTSSRPPRPDASKWSGDALGAAQMRASAQPGGAVPWAVDFATVAAIAAILFVAAKLPGMPYNVRELFGPGARGALAASGLAAVLWWLWVAPLLMMDLWRSQPERVLWLVPGLPLLALPPALVMWATVPQESLDDIVGSPVLGWSAPLEFLLRYMALHASVALAAIGAVWLVVRLGTRWRLEFLPRWFVVVLLWAWPLHAVVVDFAATDNLTELMRGGGGMAASVLLFCGVFALLVVAFAVASALMGAGRRRDLIIVAVLAWPMGVVCLWLGSEPNVFKYGRVFSAAQFLLSPDRDHYAPAAVLWLRFGLLSLGLIVLTLLLQGPRWRRFAALNARARAIAGADPRVNARTETPPASPPASRR